MKRSFWALVAGASLAALITGGIALASGTPSTASFGRWGLTASAGPGSAELTSPRITTGQTLVVVERETNGKFIDVDGQGFTNGDYVMFRDDLFNRNETKKIGFDTVQCIFAFRNALCTGSFWFEGKGQITGSGLAPDARKFVIPITGGSGRYANVRGDVLIEELRGNRSRLTFRLIP